MLFFIFPYIKKFGKVLKQNTIKYKRKKSKSMKKVIVTILNVNVIIFIIKIYLSNNKCRYKQLNISCQINIKAVIKEWNRHSNNNNKEFLYI